MGKSSKKANAEIAAPAVSIPPSKPSKKGKRDADEVIEKPVSAKKQKREVVEVFPTVKEDKKPKKAAKKPPPKKKPAPSSSDSSSSSESEEEAKVHPKNNAKPIKAPVKDSSSDESSSDEEPPKAAIILVKNPASSIQKNGSSGFSAAKGKPGNSPDSDSDSDEDTKIKANASSKKSVASKNGVATISKKKQESSDSSDSDSSSDEDSDSNSEDGAPNAAKPMAPVKVVPAASKSAQAAGLKKDESTDSSDEDSDSDSDEDDVPAAKITAADTKHALTDKKRPRQANVAKPTAPVKVVPEASKSAQAAGLKKDESTDSSDDDSDSDEDDVPAAKITAAGTKLAVTDKKHPKQAKSAAKAESSDESSDESDEEPETKKPKASVPPIVSKTGAKAKNESSSEEDESETEESSDEEPTKAKSLKTTKESTKSSSSDEESSDEESGDEVPLKTPKKDTDVEMSNAASATATAKQAENSTQKKGPKTPVGNQGQGTESKTLFVGNLSYNVGQEDVAEFFNKSGEVVEVRLAVSDDGNFRGFGHVEFASEEAAQKALELNGQELMGRGVRLDLAHGRGSYTPYSGRENKSFQRGGKTQSHTIFIKGFDRNGELDQIRSSLEEHFGSCGDITRVSVPKDYESGASKGIAYLEFKDKEAFDSALELNGSELGGYSLTVDEAKPRDDNREGGWSGGRGSGGRAGGRDSGGRFGGRRGGGHGVRGGRGGGGRGGRGGPPNRQSAGTASTGKKTTFSED